MKKDNIYRINGHRFNEFEAKAYALRFDYSIYIEVLIWKKWETMLSGVIWSEIPPITSQEYDVIQDMKIDDFGHEKALQLISEGVRLVLVKHKDSGKYSIIREDNGGHVMGAVCVVKRHWEAISEISEGLMVG